MGSESTTVGWVDLHPAPTETPQVHGAAHLAMELGAAGSASGVWGDAASGTYVIPHRLPPVPMSPQPLTIIQQLPVATAHPTGPPHLRGDLLELMMIQNSQMHQVVMNSLAVSALVSFGFGPSPATAQTPAVPLQPGEEEKEEAAMVFHHHYIPYPSSAPLWAWPLQDQAMGPAAVRHLSTAAEDREVPVPPPPPPSATGTVGANIPPAPEYYDMLEERL
ncbi:proline-rich protein 29 [Tympanuchus pallidicinctus]|uniref:proline-rich protein 29 n=1 Tax=Tympanuchus pallidicinctus TaxID=109042 RepID=UPI002286E97D|nr:proline-rich protein 29 [Tympanuchus pallidicinctus]